LRIIDGYSEERLVELLRCPVSGPRGLLEWNFVSNADNSLRERYFLANSGLVVEQNTRKQRYSFVKNTTAFVYAKSLCAPRQASPERRTIIRLSRA
jgi:hypothetical protein